METFKFFGGRLGWFCFFFGIVLLLQYANAENRTEPTANVNHSENQKWRSTFLCLQNYTSNGPCQDKHILTPVGNISVSQQELEDYCRPEQCADHIRHYVLKCIYLVMRNENKIVFKNNATVKLVNDTINQGCTINSTGIHLGYTKSSGIKIYQKTYMSLVSGLLVFLAIFNNM